MGPGWLRWQDRQPDFLAKPLVGNGEGGGALHIGMLDRQVLDLRRVDVVAAADDDVLQPPDDGQIARVVEAAQVTRQEPAVPIEGVLGRRLIVEIAERQAGALAADLADLAGLDFLVPVFLLE